MASRGLVPGRRSEPFGHYHSDQRHRQDLSGIFADLSGQTIRPCRRPWCGQPGRLCAAGPTLDLFEIDPAVVRIARDPRFFTFLSAARAPLDVVLETPGFSMRDTPPAHHRLIVLDAFSADAIPVHLLTREAVLLYLSNLDEHGLLAFHVSNRYARLKPLLAATARDASLTACERWTYPPRWKPVRASSHQIGS